MMVRRGGVIKNFLNCLGCLDRRGEERGMGL